MVFIRKIIFSCYLGVEHKIQILLFDFFHKKNLFSKTPQLKNY